VISKRVEQPVVVLIGPTAIGKTELSLGMAQRYNCEIISVDSMQVYRLLDIGTAKASREERDAVAHHLIDIVDPDEDYDAAKFAEDCHGAIVDISARGKTPLLTGGTGLYLRAVLEGIFPDVITDEKIRNVLKIRLQQEGSSKLHEELLLIDRISAERIHKNDTHRLLRSLEIFYATGQPWSKHIASHRSQSLPVQFPNLLQIGLTCPRQQLYERINLRCEEMIARGLEAEVRELLNMGYKKTLKCFGAIGYRHMIKYIDGDWSQEEMIRLLARDTRRYAKRQYTWFSKMKDLQWFDTTEKEKIFETVDFWMSQFPTEKQ
jgi:tRNA dimethylallyltransferase